MHDRIDLAAQLQHHANGRSGDEQLMEAILSTRFFAQAPEQPGFLVTATPAGPMIPVFTTEKRLAAHAGAVRWFSTTGADLISLVPVGHRFVIDPGSPHQIVVDPDALVATSGSIEE